MPHLTNVHPLHVPLLCPALHWSDCRDRGLAGWVEALNQYPGRKNEDHIWTTDRTRGRAGGGWNIDSVE